MADEHKEEETSVPEESLTQGGEERREQALSVNLDEVSNGSDLIGGDDADGEETNEEMYNTATGNGLIAIGVDSALVGDTGIPMRRGSSENDASEDQETDENQEVISRLVGLSLAEREHNEKHGVAKPPAPPGAVFMTPRESTLEFDKEIEDDDLSAPLSAEEIVEKVASAREINQHTSTTNEVAGDIVGADGETTGGEVIVATTGISARPGAFAVYGMAHTGSVDEDEWSNDRSGVASSLPPLPAHPDSEQAAVAVGSSPPEDEDSERTPIVGFRDEEMELVDVLDDPPVLPPVRRFRSRRPVVIVVICFVIVFVVILTTQLVRNKDPSSDSEDTNGWETLGEDILGPTTDDNIKFGHAISLAAAGDHLAAGVPEWDDGNSRLQVGQTHVLDWNGTGWIVSAIIEGPGAGAKAGSSVSLARNGKVVAIGAPSWQNRGHTAVYQVQSDSMWTLLGNELLGEETDHGQFGSSVTLSADGSIVAVGSPFLDGSAGVDCGVVRVFKLTNSTWTQLGQDIEGDAAFDLFGWDIELNANGLRLVVGAVGSDSSSSGTADFTGQLRIYELQDTEWVSKGPPVYGLASEDRFGHSISSSEDGSIVAVGVNNQGIRLGYVLVFQYLNDSDQWIQLGHLVGDGIFDSFGYAVSLAADGKTLATGSPLKENELGQVLVFEYSEETGSWNQIQQDISGSEEGGRFGWSVSLSRDGDRVACGAPYADFDGKVFNVGRVTVYEESIVND